MKQTQIERERERERERESLNNEISVWGEKRTCVAVLIVIYSCFS